MTITEKLIMDIAEYCYDETESWSDDGIGLHLAYLFWAIAAGGVTNDDSKALVTLLRRNESLWNRVKGYIK